METTLPDGYWTLTILVVPMATIYASIIDYRERRVPNSLNLALAATGLIACAWFGGWQGLGFSLGGLMLGFAVLIIPWAMNGMGAGDVKLMAAIGAWLGPWLTLQGFALGAIVGGVIAVTMILSAGKLELAFANARTIGVKCRRIGTAFGEFGSVKSFGTTTSLLPYGIPLTIGSLFVLFDKYWSWGIVG